MTWYPQDFTKVPMMDMRMRPQPSTGNPGRTYRFYEGEKGFRIRDQLNVKDSSNPLSESSQTPGYRLVSDIGEEQCENIKFKVTVSVKNEGKVEGKHPALLFVRHAKPGNGRPIKKMVGFQTVRLGAREKTEIEYELSPYEHLSNAKEDGVW
ncbi:SUGAR HYDROLASE-RELATED [Salix viminalis]|uniref:SUGAR HYDROLASE-RELATED n=1 Tax=Salix viminalis TaxID=40686 RepID=A0A9Q0ZIK1_SALVM|nr:SUGAR HYDROLASE-RELATED [Salix viminalis]